MINNNKITTKTPTAQIAGLHPGDSNIEFFGVHETEQVLWMRNGNVLPFQFLPKWAYRICQEKYLSDKPAIEQLQKFTQNPERQVELYIYHMYGDLDATPDLLNRKLTPSENYRHSKNDPCLEWDYKWITLGKTVLNKRDIKIIDLMLEDKSDKVITAELGVSKSTFDFHKKNLFTKAKVHSSKGLIIAALNHHV